MARQVTVGVATPLPREPLVPFGPGMPLFPSPIDPVNESTGRAEPRIYQYDVSTNLPGMTDRLIPWKILRDAAETPLVRDCIRIRKNQISTLKWDIVLTERALQQYRKEDPDTSSVMIKQKLRKELDPVVGRLVEFWEQPDVQQGQSFTEWAGCLLEEHLVLDALAIYPYGDRAGNPGKGLRILDGSTIKPLLNGMGGRPSPPHPAFQQILWGFPRGEYMADVDSQGSILNPYATDRLIYARREVRTFTQYGFSAVEQALQDVDLYLRRHEWDKAQYTQGVQPAGWIKNTGMESWSPQQIVEYNRAFNDLYAGKTLDRMRYHLLPPGMEPMESADIPEKYKPDYHLHLIKLVAMHFDTTIAELGFTESKGLGSSGYHEGQENVQERKATNPTLRWLQEVITAISRKHLGMPRELEFRFLGLDSEDEAAADEVIQKQMESGRITRNEAREEMGKPPFDADEADMPVLQTQRGIVFIDGASKLAQPGEEITPAQAPPVNGEPGTNAPGDAGTPQSAPSGQPAAKPAAAEPADGKGAVEVKKAELGAYRQWVRNNHTVGKRPFAFKAVTPDEAALCDVRLELVTFKAGDAGPKVRPGHKHWPGWEQDERIANYWSGRLRAALSEAPTRVVARRWLEVRRWAPISKAADPGRDDRRRDALAWLTAIGFTLTPRIRQVLTGLYVDAYSVGDKAAQVLLGEIEHTGWGAWKPGDTAATVREISASSGSAPGLQSLLGEAGQVADGMNNTRMRAMADRLGDSLLEETTVDELDAALLDVAGDEAAAGMAALTETGRGLARAAVDRYTIASGVTQYEWVTAGGAKVCAQCEANEAVGPIEIGKSFPYGTAPPAHPYCRCALLPVLL
jgi:Phage portal protein